MQETIVQVVKAYSVGKPPDSTIVVMPKKLGIKPGTEFCVKEDSNGRIIYEPIRKPEKKSDSSLGAEHLP